MTRSLNIGNSFQSVAKEKERTFPVFVRRHKEKMLKEILYTINDLFSKETFSFSSNINVLGGPESFFRFILFYRILSYEDEDHNVR